MEIALSFKYTLSIELLLYRFGQLYKFREKSKKKFRDIQKMNPHCLKDLFWRSPLGILRTSWESPESWWGPLEASWWGPLDVRSRRTLSVILGCHPWSSRIFRWRPEDVEKGRPPDVLGTNICWLDNVSARIFQRIYVSRHWRTIQNLKGKWFVAWKMTKEIWLIFMWAVESLKIFTLMGSFYLEDIKF